MATRANARRRGRARCRGLVIAGATLLAFACTTGQAAAGPFPGIPDPGGDPNTPVPVPPPGGKFFGYHELSAEELTHGWSAAEMATVAAGGGANTARFNITWWGVEPEQNLANDYWWNRYTRLYDAFIARGIRPIISVAGTPDWARLPIYQACGNQRGCEYAPAEYMDGQWQEFVAEVAARYPQAAAIEIWNEPNLQGFYKPNPNPWRYAQLVVKAYDAIKAVNPQMTVLAGALAPYQGDSIDRWSMKKFLDTMYAANPSVKDHMDGISFHTVWQSGDYGAESMYAKFFHDVRSVAAKFGDAGIPLWITETGLTTMGDAKFTEFQQAVGLLMQYRRLMQMPDVKAMIIHTLANRVELPPSDFNRGYGVIEGWSPFTPKLAYCWFAGRVNTPDPYGPCPKIDEDYGDETPPDTTITGGPSGTVASGTASFTYSASEAGSTFECKLDAGTYASCPASGMNYSGLADGSHTFYVRATDAAGNTDGSAATRTWVVDTVVPDTTPPNTTVTGGPSGTVASDTASFTYSSSEAGSTFECKVDAGSYASCPASGRTYPGLADGGHTFYVRATDAAGNTDGSAATRSWVIDTSVPDTTPPNTTITLGPPATSDTGDAGFAYTSSEPGSTFECSLDAGAWGSCLASGHSYSGLLDGGHTFRVRATDPAGNTDASPATRGWTIDTSGTDTTPPDTAITSGPSGTVDRRRARFEFTSSEPGSRFQCKLDSASFAPCSATGKGYSELADGLHIFKVRATDPVGNTDPSPATRSWVVDRSGGPGPDPDPATCSLRMTVLRWSINHSTGDERLRYKRQYKRLFKSCVPCGRKLTRITARIRNADDQALRSQLRQRRRRVKRRCAPCRRNLRQLEALATRTTDVEVWEEYLRQHDAARRACRGRRRSAN